MKVVRRRAYLGDDLGIRIQVDQSPGKLCSRCVVVSLAECSHSAPQCNLHVWWLHATMCEVGSELQAAFHVVWILLHHSAPLELDRNPEGVLPGQGNSVPPLPQVNDRSKSEGVSPTSLPSESEETETSNRAWSAACMTAFASGSLFPDTRRNPSESSARIDDIVRAATGKKRLGDESSGLRRRCSCNGGREGIGDR